MLQLEHFQLPGPLPVICARSGSTAILHFVHCGWSGISGAVRTKEGCCSFDAAAVEAAVVEGASGAVEVPAEAAAVEGASDAAVEGASEGAAVDATDPTEDAIDAAVVTVLPALLLRDCAALASRLLPFLGGSGAGLGAGLGPTLNMSQNAACCSFDMAFRKRQTTTIALLGGSG